jgi:hypothetical protein
MYLRGAAGAPKNESSRDGSNIVLGGSLEGLTGKNTVEGVEGDIGPKES